MFRLITVALLGAAAWSSAIVASAGSSAPRVTLEEAVRRALDAAPALKAREASVAAAEAQIAQAGMLPNPTLEAELENFAGSGRFSDLDESELTVGIAQRFERGGKRTERTAVAEAERDSASLERDKTRRSVVFEARKAFVEAFAAQASLDNAAARLKAAREIEAMARRRTHAGRDPLTAKLRAEIQTAEARTARDQAERDLRWAKKALALLWGAPDTAFEIDAASLQLPPAGDETGAAKDTALDVKLSEAAARQAEAKLKLEEANAASDFSLGLGVRRFENGGELAGVVTFSMPIAVFDDNQGNIDRAAAERRAAELDVADARQKHQTMFVAAQEEAARARAELDALRGALLPRAKAALAEARRGYNAGAFGYQDIAEGQRVLAELTKREVDALRSLHIAHAAIDRLSGEGDAP